MVYIFLPCLCVTLTLAPFAWLLSAQLFVAARLCCCSFARYCSCCCCCCFCWFSDYCCCYLYSLSLALSLFYSLSLSLSLNATVIARFALAFILVFISFARLSHYCKLIAAASPLTHTHTWSHNPCTQIQALIQAHMDRSKLLSVKLSRFLLLQRCGRGKRARISFMEVRMWD